MIWPDVAVSGIVFTVFCPFYISYIFSLLFRQFLQLVGCRQNQSELMPVHWWQKLRFIGSDFTYSISFIPLFVGKSVYILA